MKTLEKKSAPDFTLQGSDGKTHCLSDYKGRWLVIYFYPKDDTPGCTKEACAFRDGMALVAQCEGAVLGVSPDSITSHESFIETYDLPFLLLSDPDKEMMKAYEAWGLKKNYGKEYEGVIRSTVLINPEGIVMKQWSPVRKAEEHPARVLAVLDELTA